MLARQGVAEIDYIVTEGLTFDVEGNAPVRAGNAVCGIYRIKRG